MSDAEADVDADETPKKLDEQPDAEFSEAHVEESQTDKNHT
jgi:hypothetical protein